EEMRKFLAACHGHRYEAVFVLLASTGTRIGEALGLTWSCVDLDAGTVRIERVLYRKPLVLRADGEEPYAMGEPKTRKSRRTLALPAGALAMLRSHRTRQRERQLASAVWLNEWDLVFTGEHGEPVGDRMVRFEFEALLDAAGISGRRVRLHDL